MPTNEEFQNAIAQIMPEEFVTRWIVLLESTDAAGKRGLWVQCGEDMKPWDVLGMLEFAKNMEFAKEIREYPKPE